MGIVVESITADPREWWYCHLRLQNYQSTDSRAMSTRAKAYLFAPQRT